MSEKVQEGRTIEYGGESFSLDAAGAAFIDAVMEKGLPEDVAFAAFKAAAGAGAVKASAKPKKIVPQVAEMAQPVVNRGLKRNKSLKEAVGAYFHAVESLDSMTAEAGFGDGFSWGGSGQTYVRLVKDVGADGIKTTELKLDPESDIAKVAKSILDAHRLASSTVQSIVNGVAKKAEIDPCPTVKIELKDRDTIVLSQKKGKSGGGGGGGGGPRSKYNHVVGADGKIKESSFELEGKTYGPIKNTGDADAWKAEWVRIHKEAGKNPYVSSYDKKSWWPES